MFEEMDLQTTVHFLFIKSQHILAGVGVDSDDATGNGLFCAKDGNVFTLLFCHFPSIKLSNL
jgi:hypothetical protein